MNFHSDPLCLLPETGTALDFPRAGSDRGLRASPPLMFDTAIRPLEKPPDAETETAVKIAENTRDHRTHASRPQLRNKQRTQTNNKHATDPNGYA